MNEAHRNEAPVAGWLLGVWNAAGWCLLAAVVYVSLAPAPPAPIAPGGDKIGHFLAYAILMLWFAQVVTDRRWPLLAVRLLALGAGLEIAQALTGDRTPSVADIVANGAGIACAWWGVRRWRPGLLVWLAARLEP